MVPMACHSGTIKRWSNSLNKVSWDSFNYFFIRNKFIWKIYVHNLSVYTFYINLSVCTWLIAFLHLGLFVKRWVEIMLKSSK